MLHHRSSRRPTDSRGTKRYVTEDTHYCASDAVKCQEAILGEGEGKARRVEETVPWEAAKARAGGKGG
jgi:hypothetical protein